jgi:L-ascorbate metabolism protein UlaG (beta-lactamase superfamily)
MDKTLAGRFLNLLDRFTFLFAMKSILASLLAAMSLVACSSYDPLSEEKDVYPGPFQAKPLPGVNVTFLGNTTMLISDGETNLLVDGFLSRPGAVKTLFGRIAPDWQIIAKELDKANVTKVDAVLIGHAHHDHALDAPAVSLMKNCKVMGTESYRHIHEGAGARMDRLITATGKRHVEPFGKFTVTFDKSDHVGSHFMTQRLVEGDIKRPFDTPARFTRFKCGDVYAMHIKHRDHGAIVVTTTAGASDDQLEGLCSDVVFLGVGFLSKESPEKQERYWHKTVGRLYPDVIVPVHWDDFSKKLPTMQPRPRFLEDTRASIGVVKEKGGEKVLLMGLHDSLLIRNGHVLHEPRKR